MPRLQSRFSLKIRMPKNPCMLLVNAFRDSLNRVVCEQGHCLSCGREQRHQTLVSLAPVPWCPWVCVPTKQPWACQDTRAEAMEPDVLPGASCFSRGGSWGSLQGCPSFTPCFATPGAVFWALTLEVWLVRAWAKPALALGDALPVCPLRAEEVCRPQVPTGLPGHGG